MADRPRYVYVDINVLEADIASLKSQLKHAEEKRMILLKAKEWLAAYGTPIAESNAMFSNEGNGQESC